MPGLAMWKVITLFRTERAAAVKKGSRGGGVGINAPASLSFHPQISYQWLIWPNQKPEVKGTHSRSWKWLTSQVTELGENDRSGGINREYLENP